jgi:Capsule polysaccharide biosynthesis protein
MVRGLARIRTLGHKRASPWTEVLAASTRAPAPAGSDGPRVLLATSVGSHPLAPTVDSLVAMALRERGAESTMLLCDGVLPGCEACSYIAFRKPADFAAGGPQSSLCESCFATGQSYYRPLPLSVRRFGEFVSPQEVKDALDDTATMGLDEAFGFEESGLRLGEQTRASVLRFFGKANLGSEPESLVTAVARRYAAGARVAALVAERAIEDLEPTCIVAHHGVYVPQGVVGEVARRDGVRVVHWGVAYRNTMVIFSHDDTYHRTFITEPVSDWRDSPLTEAQEEELLRYLWERRLGKGDWSWVTPEAALRPGDQEQAALAEEVGLDTEKPTFGLLTNVLWDAQLYYHGQVFTDMLDWLWATLDFFQGRSDYQLIVRIHPHEIKEGNRQPVEPLLRERYPELAPNIKVVPHDHPYNTYALMDLCRAVLIYGTKTGVELAPFGTPVVACGEAWVRGKGFTHDVESRDEYLELLDRLADLEPLDAARTELARRYAYHYFFRRMIPLSSISPDGELPPTLTLETLEDLAPGRDRGLDVICTGILEGRPFALHGSD